MIRKIICLQFILVIFCFGDCYAQKKMDSIKTLFITVTPTSLLNYHQGIQAGVEIGINNFGYVEGEASYLLKSDFYSANEQLGGYRLSLSYKYPLTMANDIKLIALLQYRNSEHIITSEFERGFGSYFEEISYEQKRELLSFALGFAYSANLKKVGEVELSARTGFGGIDIVNDELPSDAILIDESFGINTRYLDGGSFTTPIIGISVKFKFRI